MTALFISPHLDDVAFSCGGTFYGLAVAGWRCVLLTVFTRSVPNPTGFALACQTDKGLAPEVDYMALRRAEDLAAAHHLRATAVRHFDLPEAPHRGYESAPALFADFAPADDVLPELTQRLAAAVEAEKADLLLAPQGLGGHVDHRRVMQAVRAVAGERPVMWYRDTPYIIRQPDAQPAPELPGGLIDGAIGWLTEAALKAKIAASQAYATQIGFQFGGPAQVAAQLTALGRRETDGAGLGTSWLVERGMYPRGLGIYGDEIVPVKDCAGQIIS